jgi:hypothetical protein
LPWSRPACLGHLTGAVHGWQAGCTSCPRGIAVGQL